MKNILKVGMLGLGGIAHYHVPGWKASADTELIAGSDINPALFPKWQDKHGVTRFYDNPMDLIQDPDIDIIDICSPNRYHMEQTIAALEAGKHVLCEKPLAPTPAEIKQMIAARDRSGKKLMTAQHFRFTGISQAMQTQITKGILGEVYHARAWWLRRNFLPIAPTFIHQKHSGGGPCIDIGVHVLDLALWLMGHPRPVAVSGVAKAPLAHHPGAFTAWGNHLIPADMDVEDFAAALVRFENGATLILEVSWLLHHATEDIKVWLYGTEAGCEWPKGEFYTTDYQAIQQFNNIPQLIEDRMEPHALECVEFARAIREDLPSPVPAEQSLHVQAILDGIYRSQACGHEVSIEIPK